MEDVGEIGQHSGVSSLSRHPMQSTLSVTSSSKTDSEIGEEEQPNEKLSTPELPTSDNLLGKIVPIEDVGDIGQNSGVSNLSRHPLQNTLWVTSSSNSDSEIGEEEQPNE